MDLGTPNVAVPHASSASRTPARHFDLGPTP